jgi:hypothetical protein
VSVTTIVSVLFVVAINPPPVHCAPFTRICDRFPFCTVTDSFAIKIVSVGAANVHVNG